MGASGTIALPGVAAARRAFPHAAKALGAHAVAALAGLSRVVGMECPGRDSLLSAVEVVVTRRAASNRLSWRVGKADPRFKLLRLQVGNECLSGTVDAFLTQPPSEIPIFEGVAAQVDPTEFAGQRALIVGGSRGLGAATALIIASGGGLPLVTFASGSAEVALLRREARRAGRRIDALRFDVITDSTDRLRRGSRRFGVTHLYYFATPRIFARRREPFDAMLFERFAAFYLKGFADACAAAGASGLTVFYPSSTALDEPVRELTEYAAAKAAGEVLCRQLAAMTPGLRVVVHRLGRIATDQTASVVAAPAVDPVPVMLPIVREMHRVARDGR